MEHIGFHYLFTNIQLYTFCILSFGIEYIPQEVLNKARDKSITRNIFRLQDNESITCGFQCFAFL